MSDFLIVAVVVAIVLTVITLVGHGIWVLLAAIFGGARRKPSQTCPFCRRATSAGHNRCEWCSQDLGSPLAAELNDLEVVRRQLHRFRQKGVLKPQVFDRLLSQLQDYRLRLIRPAAEVHAPPLAAIVVDDSAHASQSAAPPPVVPAAAQQPETAIPATAPSPVAVLPSTPHADLVKPPADSQRPALSAALQTAPKSKPSAHPPAEPPRVAAVPARPAKPQPPAPPSRSWTEMLAAFMEQRNIRWGELIGGLLFVCSSVALVVSLWETLEKIPYSKFFIFVSISSAVFGVGLYAHHRWKLESTSRALLVIGTLLVPLNFVAMAVMAQGTWTLLTLASELISLAIFTYLVGLAVRILVPDGRWLIVAAVLGDSITVLVAAQLLHAGSPAWLIVGIGALPVVLLAGAVGCYLYSRFDRAKWRPLQLTDEQIGFIFTLLGITAFSTVVAMSLVVARAITPLDTATQIAPHEVASVLQRLSALLAATGVPVLAAGLTAMRGSRRNKELAAYHLAGTIVSLVAMLVMLAALVVAWPAPGWLIAVAVLNTATLVLAAFRWRLPILHAGAIACAAMAYLTAFHLVTAKLASPDADPYGMELLKFMISAKSGTALAGLFLVLAAASEGLARVGRHRDGVIYLSGSSLVAVSGLLLVSVHGMLTGGADALRAAILYGVYGAGSLALAARWRRLVLTYLGLTLVTLAALWALWWQSAAHHVGPLWGAVLAIESLAMAVVAAVLQRYEAAREIRGAERAGDRPQVGAWYDPWNMIDQGSHAASVPRSQGLSRFDLYRIPLAHIGEAAAMLAVALTAWTAWFDRAVILASPTPAPIIAGVSLATVYFLLAWLYRSPERTWAASLIVAAGAVHSLNFNYFDGSDSIGPNWTIALLGHATLAMAAVFCLDRLRRAGEVVGRVICHPLANAALLMSILALPALVFGRSAGNLWLACCFPWLAAVWLALAWRNRSVALFAAHQVALTFAALAVATVWMKHAGWITPAGLPPAPNLLERIASVSHSVLVPQNLQAYGVALAILSLAWAVARIISQRFETGARPLLRGLLSVDRCTSHGVVAMQWLVAALCTLTEIQRELLGSAAGSAAPAAIPSAFGPAAWILLGVLAVLLIVSLWERWQTAELISSLLAAATLPCLIAGRFATDLAVASAARWALAVGFAAYSIAVWGRKSLVVGSRQVHARPFVLDPESSDLAAPRVARSVLLATMALPVLAITVMAAMLQLGGAVPGGPVAATFFANLGPTPSYLVPLALLIVTLVGYALRERSSGYAFSAGLVLELAVVLGYALHTKLARLPFDAALAVTLLQLFAITAAVWAILWLITRKRLDVWREAPADGPLPLPAGQGASGGGAWSSWLMRIQIGMSILANVLVLGIALFVLSVAPIDRQWWSVAAGGPLGWICLALPLAALRLRGPLRPQAVGLSGMAVLGLLACTVRGLQPHWHLEIDPIWGYRALMLGWAVYAVLIVAATSRIASLRTSAYAAGPPQALIRMAAVWVRVAGILAVLLGLKAAFWHQGEQLWAAAAIALASGAGAAMAVWRRREGWAFAAALGVNMAASLVVWHFELLRQLSFNDYWLRLVQANVIASSAVGAAWLAARKRLYELSEDRARTKPVPANSPLLALQVLLPVAGNCVLLILPVAWLIHTPGRLPQWMHELAAPHGWLGLVLTAAIAAWYLRQSQLGSLLHVLGGLAIGAGVLAACCVEWVYASSPPNAWTAYHALTTAWAASGLIVLAIAMAAARWFGPRALVEPWVAAIGTLTVAMAALHAFYDPARPWWAAGAILAVSFTAALVAILLRKPAHVYVSGLLINLAGTIIWCAYSSSGAPWPDWSLADVTGLVQANVLCLAIGSVAWSLVELLPNVVPLLKSGEKPLFARLAAQSAVVGLGLVVAAGVLVTLANMPQIDIGRLDWIALAGAVAATSVCRDNRGARSLLPTHYCLGLSAVGLGLLTRQLGPRMFCWSAVDELSAYALVAAAIARFMARRGTIPGCEGPAPLDSHLRFSSLQAVTTAVTAALALWVTIDFNFDSCHYENFPGSLAGRIFAVPGLAFLLLTAIVMAGFAGGAWRARWQNATLALSVLLLSGLGWAMLSAGGPTPWLHRSVIVMVAAVATGALASFGLKRILPTGSDWHQRGRQAVPALAGLAIGMLAVVLAQETMLFKLSGGVPMLPVAIAVVIAALAGLIAGCIAMAVSPALDPLGFSDRGRQAYVYAAEALAAAIGLHVWLTMPWLFKGYLVDYWMLIVMAVAFTGAGLSEWFHRRRVAVLSQPLAQTALLLPLLPAVGFWLAPVLEGPWRLVGRSPAVWLLMALFYGFMAATRRSWKCAALAVLTANLGLWVGLELSGFQFLRNPQLFVIPVALAGLVAEYLNHNRLTDAQSVAFRYLTLSAIYVSSTADMFIAGLGNSWALPLVLMVLSVAGMLAGILFRVRSFLFLGLTFLVLDAMSMIWHAAHDLHHTWIWYVCGIALGAAILAMFAVFEKRRNDVLAAVEHLKDWAK